MLLLDLKAENGYRLWLRYEPATAQDLLMRYRDQIKHLTVDGRGATMQAAASELKLGLSQMLTSPISESIEVVDGSLVVGRHGPTGLLSELLTPNEVQGIEDEGFIILTKEFSGHKLTIISGVQEVGVLYGTFHFLRMLQTGAEISNLNIRSNPARPLRMIHHCDLLDRSVVDGRAGPSLWQWHRLPGYIDARYIDYARANASIGVNAIILNQATPDMSIFSPAYIQRVAALANTFRPFGIRIFLAGRLGDLLHNQDNDALFVDSLMKELYRYIPDFGGLQLEVARTKAGSFPLVIARQIHEITKALRSFGGKALVRLEDATSHTAPSFLDDCIRVGEFVSKIKRGAMVQIPVGLGRQGFLSPFNPSSFEVDNSKLLPEFQLDHRLGRHQFYYIGQALQRYLRQDLRDPSKLEGMVAVANTGMDLNWTGHPLGQANWYVFGRLLWEGQVEESDVRKEWIKMTLGHDDRVIGTVDEILQLSAGAVVDAGFAQMGMPSNDSLQSYVYSRNRMGHAFGADFPSDSMGLGFDPDLGNLASLYPSDRSKTYSDIRTCPEPFLPWFHRLSWQHRMPSGQQFFEYILERKQDGIAQMDSMLGGWTRIKDYVDEERFGLVQHVLRQQLSEVTANLDSWQDRFQRWQLPSEGKE